jgi:site-specific recombinase XerD
MSLEELLEEYLQDLVRNRGRTTRTAANYRNTLKSAVARAPQWSAEELQDVVATDASGEPYASSTRNHRITIVKAFSKYALARGVIPADTAANLKRTAPPHVARVAISAQELERVLKVVRCRPAGWVRTRDEVLVLMPYYSGLRVSEMVSLDWDQVDMLSRIARSVVRKGGGTTDVHLHTGLVEPLQALLETTPTAEGPVFINATRRGRLSVRAVQKLYRRLGEHTGLGPRFHPHAGRHAHATALLRNDTSVEIIRQSLNHRSLQTTQRYLHGDPSLVAKAIDRLPSI